ncbi:MAG: LysR family transcriptional regulator [Hyphomicrobium sp.]|nr:MAG: LysR family transcriptional regulator [Hyphomicrobium sp.]
MNFDDLALFLAVARRGNFATVAKDLAVDPSSVSRGIADLEAALGVRLFQRTTRRVTLTEAGALYLASIEPLIDELRRANAAIQNAQSVPRGLLRISTSVTFGQKVLVPLLPAFRAHYPELAVEGVFTDANVDLVTDRIDLAVRLAPTIEGDLIAAKLMDTRYRVVASKEYLKSSPRLVAPADLARHRVLLFNLPGFRKRWLFRDRKSGPIVEVPIAGDITLAPAGALLEAAITGLGPVMLPDWLVDADIAAGRLRNVFPRHDVTATTFETAAWLVYPSRAYLPNKVRVMIDFLKFHLASP